MSIGIAESVLRRDRAIVLAGVVSLTVLAWAYTVHLASDMGGMVIGNTMAMPRMPAWTAFDFALTFIMWVVMMVAMMVPTAAPMILMFAGLNRRRGARQDPLVPTSVFVLGYLVIWTGFAALATVAQWWLHATALLSPMMAATSPLLGGALLVTAGVFQWTPIKHGCLTRCRTPLGFLLAEWRDGRFGALVMGLRHGAFCLGCCWALMSLMFVLGVMNLLWIAALAILMLVEKVGPLGQWTARISGLLLLGWGAWVMAAALV